MIAMGDFEKNSTVGQFEKPKAPPGECWWGRALEASIYQGAWASVLTLAAKLLLETTKT
jgi:hypothetical protein